MQVVIACVLSLAVSGLAKPFYGQFVRLPRSHGYGGGGYISPCASAGAYQHAIPAYHAQSYGPVGYGHPHIGGIGGGGGGGGVGGYGGVGAAGGYGGYGAPHYRANDMEEGTGEESEMMSFSEVDPSENAPEARYVSVGGGYGAPHGISAVAPASPGAVGVFPSAHVGGCSVPLLLSCSPSIVPGRIVSHGHAAYGAGSYSAGSYGAGSYGTAAIAGAGAYRSEGDAPHDLKPSEQPEGLHTTTVHEGTNVSSTKPQNPQ